MTELRLRKVTPLGKEDWIPRGNSSLVEHIPQCCPLAAHFPPDVVMLLQCMESFARKHPKKGDDWQWNRSNHMVQTGFEDPSSANVDYGYIREEDKPVVMKWDQHMASFQHLSITRGRRAPSAKYIVDSVDFTRLRHLWARRSTASQDEWHELLQLVERVLRRAKILVGLDREDMVQGYLAERVFAGNGQSVPENEPALLSWFQRYQSDQLTKEKRNGISSDADPEAAINMHSDPTSIDEVMFRDHRVGKIDEFFTRLSDQERLLIRFSFCDDESILSVQDQHKIRSAHYQCKQLGIVLSKSAIPADWVRTKLGRLMTDLGVRIEHKPREDFLQVIRLLCERALKYRSAQ